MIEFILNAGERQVSVFGMDTTKQTDKGITKEQAIALGSGALREEIHCEVVRSCKFSVGPRGGVEVSIVRVRPSGRCQTWKTRPNEFRLPIKYGLYESSAITHQNCDSFHLASDCRALAAMESIKS